MKNTMKKNILGRVAMLATLICVTGMAHGTENETNIKSYGTLVFEVDKSFVTLFNQKDKTPFEKLVLSVEKLLTDFQRKVEPSVTRHNADELTTLINNLLDYSLFQFNIACTMMKKYIGKPSSEAANFGTEFKRDFNTEKIFGEIIAQLNIIKCKAQQLHEDALAKNIATVITMIEKKRKEWNAKSDWTLLAGLSYRMGCK